MESMSDLEAGVKKEVSADVLTSLSNTDSTADASSTSGDDDDESYVNSGIINHTEYYRGKNSHIIDKTYIHTNCYISFIK
jgi:hypothetical protein